MSNRKAPADHKPKKDAAERLRDEAARLPGLEQMAGFELKVKGRNGEVTVTTLDSPLDWDADCMAYLREGDYLSAICGMVSDEDVALLRAVKPSIGSLLAALMESGEESVDLSPGESQAS